MLKTAHRLRALLDRGERTLVALNALSQRPRPSSRLRIAGVRCSLNASRKRQNAEENLTEHLHRVLQIDAGTERLALTR